MRKYIEIATASQFRYLLKEDKRIRSQNANMFSDLDVQPSKRSYYRRCLLVLLLLMMMLLLLPCDVSFSTNVFSKVKFYF